MGKRAKRKQRATMNKMNQMAQNQLTDFQERQKAQQAILDKQKQSFKDFKFENPFAEMENVYEGMENMYEGMDNVYGVGSTGVNYLLSNTPLNNIPDEPVGDGNIEDSEVDCNKIFGLPFSNFSSNPAFIKELPCFNFLNLCIFLFTEFFLIIILTPLVL